jgi:hypothetical protein
VLKREKIKLQNEFDALREASERNRQVAKAIGKSAELAAQPALAQELQDARAAFENEKRRLFSDAVDEFRTYLNASEALDKRLTDSEAVVGRLVGAAPGQPIDDAGAQFAN